MNIINEHYKCSLVMIISYEHFLCPLLMIRLRLPCSVCGRVSVWCGVACKALILGNKREYKIRQYIALFDVFVVCGL